MIIKMENKIYPCLWFDGNAKVAAEFYCSVFDNSRIISDNPFVVTFNSSGQKFMCLNGGPAYKPKPSISFYIICETINEIETTWNKLLEGGKVLMPLDKYDWSEKYGWVQDKFGISWQLAFGKFKDVGQKFTPMLMFTNKKAGRALEAIKFYTSVFHNSSIVGVLKYTAGENDVLGYVKHAQFKLGQQVFMAMDSSLLHDFNFNEAISLVVECDTQKEIDFYWGKLGMEGEEGQCGWLKDKFGVSWQVVPFILGKLMNDPEKAPKVMQAFMKMKKFEIEKLVNV